MTKALHACNASVEDAKTKADANTVNCDVNVLSTCVYCMNEAVHDMNVNVEAIADVDVITDDDAHATTVDVESIADTFVTLTDVEDVNAVVVDGVAYTIDALAFTVTDSEVSKDVCYFDPS